MDKDLIAHDNLKLHQENQHGSWADSFQLSQRFKDAFKIAVAIVITYAIALSQGWGTPFWAWFAVAFAIPGLQASDPGHAC